MKSKCNLLSCIVSILVGASAAASAANLTVGFSETVVAAGLSNPTAMEFAPDGRLFVCEQGGRLRVINSTGLLPTPFLTVTTDANGERGLLGVTFDPAFAANHLVYIYYTVPGSPAHNRVSRFTANGDVAAGAGTSVLELNALSDTAQNHNGGAIHFGPDGKLYIGVGENATGTNAQTLVNLLGKILRIDADGSVPTDNPFFNQAIGINGAIWALGLRNPFTFAFQPGTGRMFINDVGENTWEEINDGIVGSNYGWPNCEGACNKPSFRDPIYQYSHSDGCAISGGAFYNPATMQFPADYLGVYFHTDLCGGWIRILDPENGNQVFDFATGISSPVDVKVSADGFLYYLARGGGGSVTRVEFDNTPPAVVILSFFTTPKGLDLVLDGQRRTTPFLAQSVVGSSHTLSAPSSQRVDKSNYRFASWSDGGAQTHTIVTPGNNTIYTATYQSKGRGAGAIR